MAVKCQISAISCPVFVDYCIDEFTQEIVNLIFSHVNAVSRNLYSGKSAYDMFSFLYPDGLAACLGIQHIPADMVCQSPRLLKGVADLNKGI